MEHIDIDRTDEEREEQVKQWIKDYWLMMVLAVAAAIGAVYGLNYFKQSRLSGLNDLAVQYEQVGQALTKKDLKTAQSVVTTLQNDAKNTAFSTLSTLALAKYYFEEKDYKNAATQYDWLLAHAQETAVRDVARLRKARSQANQQLYKDAVTTLSTVESNSNITEANLLKGDFLLADKQYDAAKQAYELLAKNQSMNAEIIRQRLELATIRAQKQQ